MTQDNTRLLRRHVGEGDLHLHARLHADARDLLHHLARAHEVNHALVHLELEPVVRVGAVTAGRLARGVAQHLGGHADGALDLEVLLLGAADEVRAHWNEDDMEWNEMG